MFKTAAHPVQAIPILPITWDQQTFDTINSGHFDSLLADLRGLFLAAPNSSPMTFLRVILGVQTRCKEGALQSLPALQFVNQMMKFMLARNLIIPEGPTHLAAVNCAAQIQQISQSQISSIVLRSSSSAFLPVSRERAIAEFRAPITLPLNRELYASDTRDFVLRLESLRLTSGEDSKVTYTMEADPRQFAFRSTPLAASFSNQPGLSFTFLTPNKLEITFSIGKHYFAHIQGLAPIRLQNVTQIGAPMHILGIEILGREITFDPIQVTPFEKRYVLFSGKSPASGYLEVEQNPHLTSSYFDQELFQSLLSLVPDLTGSSFCVEYDRGGFDKFYLRTDVPTRTDSKLSFVFMMKTDSKMGMAITSLHAYLNGKPSQSINIKRLVPNQMTPQGMMQVATAMREFIANVRSQNP